MNVGGAGPSTRGGLKPAKLKNLKNTSKVVNFMFNPAEVEFIKENNWTAQDSAGQDVPRYAFQHGNAQTLKLVLHFDTLDTGVDVRRTTVDLWDMMKVDSTLHNPPPVAFEWGKIYFKAIIKSLREKFTLFDAEGTPLRCECTVDLIQYVEESDTPRTIEYGGVNPASVIAIEGSRLDLIAAGMVGTIMAAQTVAQAVRTVAEVNGIDNPLAIPNGLEISS